ncbi:MAG: CidA/LrgA family protein [Piscinibacter sp.]|uniref:CidA/LrgA family protein n=1 Tax=Piscinibacter sp. TaxID=1903157 RepID=UPI00258FFFB6|nr:CidA/LrgA family protein [Piscinibacter sp.]MCW5667888.1 CidA/LrgA family protein [Piscinibacter sp.]
MLVLRGLAWLLLAQSLGEALARLLELKLPGPVLGLLLMLAALSFEAVRTPVAAAADTLLAHLSLLFVPVGVGVMTHLGLLAQYGLRMLLVIVASTFVGLAVTALVLRAALRGQG